MAMALGTESIFLAVLTEGCALWVCGEHEIGTLGLGPLSRWNNPARRTRCCLAARTSLVVRRW